MTNVEIYLLISSPAECVSYYQVEWKLPSEGGYTLGLNQFESPIVLPQLQEGTTYNVRITPFCCNGQYGTPLILDVITGGLDTPTGFTATPADSEVDLDWDDMPDADNYVLEMDTLPDFSTATEIYNGATSDFLKTSLINGEVYYFRVKQQRTGYPDSDWATDSATPAL